MAKELKFTGQSFKSLREHYNMTYAEFNKCIKSIRKKLDKMAGRKNYRNLTPKQVIFIIKHLG